MILDPFYGTSFLLCTLVNTQKTPVPLNGLKIFLTNMPAERSYPHLFHKGTCFLLVDLHWFFQCAQEV